MEAGDRGHDLEPEPASCTSTHCGEEMKPRTSDTEGTPFTTARVPSGPNLVAVDSIQPFSADRE